MSHTTLYKNITVAVLLATFNRREKTLACLRSLGEQQLPEGVRLKIFLTDDNSQDGTFEAVKQHFPEVHLHQGTGSLYWAGGMRYTWRKALPAAPEFYLLLNDDTLLAPDAIDKLLQSTGHDEAIVAGATRDQRGQVSYGGWKLRSRWLWKSQRIPPQDQTATCDFANANILLVPGTAVNNFGILSDHFTHSLADYDYTLRAKRAGWRICVAPGFLGSCEDDHGNNWKPSSTSLKERLRYLKSPKGLAYSEYLRFIRDHFPLSYPSAFCKLWMKTLFPFLWDRLKKNGLPQNN